MREGGQPVEQLASLHTIGNGSAAAKFGAELEKVLENIRESGTDATAKRKIVLEFTFQPDSDREVIATSIKARSTLAATKPTSDVMWIGSKDGVVVATVVHPEPVDPRQGTLHFPVKESAS